MIEHSSPGAGGLAWSVPKQSLISGVHLLLENGRSGLPGTCEMPAPWFASMLDMRSALRHRGGLKMGVEGCGQMALACGSALPQATRLLATAAWLAFSLACPAAPQVRQNSKNS